MSFFIHHKRFFLVWLVSLCAGLVALAAVYGGAQSRGLNPLAFMGDVKGYLLLAENLYEHGVFSLSLEEPLMPDSFRAPGYPSFLAALYAVFGSWLMVLVAQSVVVSVAPALLYLVVRPLHERAAWWGSIAFALEPIRLFASSVLLSDALFVCLLLGMLLLFIKAVERSSLALVAGVGLLLGAAILVRPIAQFLPLVLLGYLAFQRVPWRRALPLAAVFLLVCAALVLPWMARNHARFGSWSISSVSTYNLAVYNAPEYARYRPSGERAQILEAFAARQAALPQHEQLSLARAGEFSAVFWDVVRGSEPDYALFHVFKTIPFFLTDGLRDTVRLFGVELRMPNITSALLSGKVGELGASLRGDWLSVALLVAGSGTWALVLCLCAWLIYLCLRGRADKRWLFFAALALYFALLTGPVSNARYRLPAEGFLFVGAAATVLMIRKREA